MRLTDTAGYGLDLVVVGYQVPDAENPEQRCSWHMVEGTAACPEGSWGFLYPALTCDESPQLSTWLRQAARREVRAADVDEPEPAVALLTFAEPNLTMAVAEYGANVVVLDVGFDLEFSPPWRRSRAAGNPFVVRCQLTPEQLERAAARWDDEIAPYPDLGQ